ncbi:MAG: adenylate cyclase [Dehalococcoidia bacterium]
MPDIDPGHLEIERRFLVEAPPEDAASYPHAELLQGYVSFYFESADGTEVRLRSEGSSFVETLKRGSGGVRWESEREIDRAEFEARWPQVGDRFVSKTRYRLPGGIELDVFHGRFEGLACAEVEFPDEAASRAFEPPPWFGREITDDVRYTHTNLIVDGLPSETGAGETH